MCVDCCVDPQVHGEDEVRGRGGTRRSTTATDSVCLKQWLPQFGLVTQRGIDRLFSGESVDSWPKLDAEVGTVAFTSFRWLHHTEQYH